MPLSQHVKGTVTEGHKIASGLAKDNPFGDSTIKMQAPLFKERGLDLSGCYKGTLNVSIEPRTREVLVKEPHYRGLKWHPDYPAEDFFVFKCLIQFRGSVYDGWVYYPDPSKKIGFQHKPDTFEIIAPLIPEIKYGDSVTLVVNPDEIKIN